VRATRFVSQPSVAWNRADRPAALDEMAVAAAGVNPPLLMSAEQSPPYHVAGQSYPDLDSNDAPNADRATGGLRRGKGGAKPLRSICFKVEMYRMIRLTIMLSTWTNGRTRPNGGLKSNLSAARARATRQAKSLREPAIGLRPPALEAVGL
jgi:hypothetical protein